MAPWETRGLFLSVIVEGSLLHDTKAARVRSPRIFTHELVYLPRLALGTSGTGFVDRVPINSGLLRYLQLLGF